MSTEQKPKFLRIFFRIHGLGCFPGILRTRKKMKYQDGVDYLFNFDDEIKHSCVCKYCIDAYELINPPTNRDSVAGLDITMHREKMCGPSTRCAKNIRDGKCRDAFIIKNIGQKFFADKYNNKTK